MVELTDNVLYGMEGTVIRSLLICFRLLTQLAISLGSAISLKTP